ncbi:tetratricopeptide repeat protein [bacterium]|nr:tetratricopeptide repeat protein [bacterium]QQR56259.1 MAG: tetratricopeptide repeat protein [Candidatus Melainabacteria bacterium]
MFERQKLLDTTTAADKALDEGNLDRAEVLFTQAICIADKLYGSNSVSVCSLMLSLTRIYEKRGDKEKASFIHSRIKDLVSAPHEVVSVMTIDAATTNSAENPVPLAPAAPAKPAQQLRAVTAN